MHIQQEWLHKFLGYDFTIEYKLRKDNLAADALSRSFFMAISQPQSKLLSQIEGTITNDPELTEIRNKCLQGAAPNPLYQVVNNLLYWKQRLVVPPQPELIAKILTEFHSSPLGGHSAIARTKARVMSLFFFWARYGHGYKSICF